MNRRLPSQTWKSESVFFCFLKWSPFYLLGFVSYPAGVFWGIKKDGDATGSRCAASRGRTWNWSHDRHVQPVSYVREKNFNFSFCIFMTWHGTSLSWKRSLWSILFHHCCDNLLAISYMLELWENPAVPIDLWFYRSQIVKTSIKIAWSIVYFVNNSCCPIRSSLECQFIIVWTRFCLRHVVNFARCSEK